MGSCRGGKCCKRPEEGKARGSRRPPRFLEHQLPIIPMEMTCLRQVPVGATIVEDGSIPVHLPMAHS